MSEKKRQRVRLRIETHRQLGPTPEFKTKSSLSDAGFRDIDTVRVVFFAVLFVLFILFLIAAGSR